MIWLCLVARLCHTNVDMLTLENLVTGEKKMEDIKETVETEETEVRIE